MSNALYRPFCGDLIFSTVHLVKPDSDLLIREIDLLRHTVSLTRRELPFGIEAWVVLPNHIHAIWRLPTGDTRVEQRWAVIKSRFLCAVRDVDRVGFDAAALESTGVLSHTSEIWKPEVARHDIQDKADLDLHLRHCFYNPVRHGLVARPEDWPYSFAHRDRRYVSDGLASQFFVKHV